MDVILSILNFLLWLYGFNLYKTSEKIEYQVKLGNKKVLIFFFALAGILHLTRNFNFMGIFQCISLILFGIFYSTVGSGFNMQGVIVQGRFYDYKKITNFSYEYEMDTDVTRINIAYGRKMFLFFIKDNEKPRIEEYRKAYLKR